MSNRSPSSRFESMRCQRRAFRTHTPRIAVERLEDRLLLSGVGLSPSPTAPTFGQLPLFFEMNQGQAHEAVKFVSRGDGYAVFLTPQEAVLSITGAEEASSNDVTGVEAIRMQLHGSNPAPHVVGLEELGGRSNYLIGNDPQGWVTGVQQFSKVLYDEVYPGVDLLFYGNQRELEYDFIVSAGVDPKVIEFGFAGVTDMTLDNDGNLVLSAAVGDLIQRRPVLFQEISGERHAVDGEFQLLNDGSVKFQVGVYDSALPLIIDPVLSYSTYLGGTGDDSGAAVAVDADGNVLVAGSTSSRDSSVGDAFVMKFDPTGTTLIYATYLGGGNGDSASAIEVGRDGSIYIAGDTSSSDFPTTPGAFDTTINQGALNIGDGFVAKLDPTGLSLIYSTFLGGGEGRGGEGIRDLAVDELGHAYVTGGTGTVDFPTKNAVQPNHAGINDAFITKLNPTGTDLVYSTLFGGTAGPHDFETNYGIDIDVGYGIDIDSRGNAYVVGMTRSPDFPLKGAIQSKLGGPQDGFLLKLTSEGELVFSTFLGGTSFDAALGVAVDAVGNSFITGVAHSLDFPVVNAVQPQRRGQFCAGERANLPCSDAFVAKVSPTGESIEFSTYLGGTADEHGQSIALDSEGNVYVAGTTYSPDFPTKEASQDTLGGGVDRCWLDVEIQAVRCSPDAFVTKIEAGGGSIGFSTYVGGRFLDTGNGVAVDAAGNAYVTGLTTSDDLPVLGALSPSHASGGVFDGYLAKLGNTPLPPRDTSASSVAAQTTTSDPTADGLTEAGRSVGPSGNVIAAVIGGRLWIYGDMADNEVRIETGTDGLGSIKLTPGSATTINGNASSVEFVRIRKGMRIRMGGGSDTLIFDGSAQPLQIPGKTDLRTDSLDSVQVIDAVLADLFRGLRSARRGARR